VRFFGRRRWCAEVGRRSKKTEAMDGAKISTRDLQQLLRYFATYTYKAKETHPIVGAFFIHFLQFLCALVKVSGFAFEPHILRFYRFASLRFRCRVSKFIFLPLFRCIELIGALWSCFFCALKLFLSSFLHKLIKHKLYRVHNIYASYVS
jgi:hypothetical protein